MYKPSHYLGASIRQFLYSLALMLTFADVGFSQGFDVTYQKTLNKFESSESGTVSVIIQSRAPGSNGKKIKERVEQVFSSTPSLKGRAKYKRFKYSPMISAEVTQQQLLDLISDPEIVVVEDTLKRPSLAQSVSRVYPSQNTSSFHGNDWAVAVLDTGINKDHPFLSNKVVSEACFSGGGSQPNATSLCPNGQASSLSSNSGLNCNLAGCEHGTQVAGVAVGNGSSFDGVAKDGQLISIQVYSQINDESFCFPSASCIGAFTSDIISALEHVFDLRSELNIASVNLSLGSDELFSGSCDSQPERPIIDLLTSANIAVVAASGNSGATTQMQSPACISTAIAVAATSDTSDSPWSGNNISNQLDFFAPGVNITSSDSNGGFSSLTGTSLAAPHLAGAFAVLKSASPSVTIGQAESLLKSSGSNVTQHSVTRRRINLSTALSNLVVPPDNPSPGIGRENTALPAIFLLLLDDS